MVSGVFGFVNVIVGVEPVGQEQVRQLDAEILKLIGDLGGSARRFRSPASGSRGARRAQESERRGREVAGTEESPGSS